ncbi:MAG TPA: hypothetical protein VGN07_00510 [Steroidobacteraceae bacterium]|jgi:hypothetical protein
MTTRSLLCAAAFLAAALASQPAGASFITGSFSGIATGNLNNPANGTQSPFAESVTGTFLFDTTIPPTEPYSNPPTLADGVFTYSGQFAFDLAVRFMGQDLPGAVLLSGSNHAELVDRGAGQSFTLSSGGPYQYGILSFADPDGRLFSNFDPTTFDPRQVDIGQSFVRFSDNIRLYNATVAFDSLIFDGYPQQVPEPATLGMLALGLLLLLPFTRPLSHSGLRRRLPK